MNKTRLHFLLFYIIASITFIIAALFWRHPVYIKIVLGFLSIYGFIAIFLRIFEDQVKRNKFLKRIDKRFKKVEDFIAQFWWV